MICESKLTSCALPDLSRLVKAIWSHSDEWRLQDGKVEWSIKSSYGRQWFPLYQSPASVEDFVNAYINRGGLSEATDNKHEMVK